ncbi:MAG: PcfB family protein [Parasporobacterium sp.]|nr:PcfB family protein [Parasporobacterium sp.]
MQEEISQRTVAIMIRGAEFSADTLQKSIKAVLNHAKNKVKKSVNAEHKGRQSLRSLQKEKTSLSTVELNRQNLSGFERIARKYGIEYSLVKDKTSEVPNYILFFKGKDEAVMNTAFREYAKKKHGIEAKESIRESLKEIQAHPEKYQKKQKTKTKQKVKVKKKEVVR